MEYTVSCDPTENDGDNDRKYPNISYNYALMATRRKWADYITNRTSYEFSFLPADRRNPRESGISGKPKNPPTKGGPAETKSIRQKIKERPIRKIPHGFSLGGNIAAVSNNVQNGLPEF